MLVHGAFFGYCFVFTMLFDVRVFSSHCYFISKFFLHNKGKGIALKICIAPPHEASLRHSGISRIVEGYHSFTYTPCISSTSGMSHMCPGLPSHSWDSLPTREGWKAE